LALPCRNIFFPHIITYTTKNTIYILRLVLHTRIALVHTHTLSTPSARGVGGEATVRVFTTPLRWPAINASDNQFITS